MLDDYSFNSSMMPSQPRKRSAELLRSLGMEDYVEAWQDAAREGGRVDGPALAAMDNRKLEAAGMLFKPHRKTLLALLAVWRSKGCPLRQVGIYTEGMEEVLALLPAHQVMVLTHLSVLPGHTGSVAPAAPRARRLARLGRHRTGPPQRTGCKATSSSRARRGGRSSRGQARSYGTLAKRSRSSRPLNRWSFR